MGIVIRQSVGSTIINYAGFSIGLVNVFFLSSYFLTREEIGLNRFLLETTVVIATLSQFGLPYLVDRYFPYFKDSNQKDHGFLALVTVYCTIGLCLMLGLMCFFQPQILSFYAEKSPYVAQYFSYLYPLVIAYAYIILLESYLRIQGFIIVSAFTKEIVLKLINCVLILLYGYHIITLELFVWGLLLAHLAGILIMCGFVFYKARLHVQWSNYVFHQGLARPMLLFGGLLFITTLGTVLIPRLDTLILPGVARLEFAGIYVVANSIAISLEISKRSLSQVSSVLSAQAWKDQQMDIIRNLYRKSAIALQFFGGLLLTCILVCLDEVYRIMPNGDQFALGKTCVWILGFARLFDLSFGATTEIIMSSPKYKFIMFISLIMVFGVTIGNYHLINIYGMNGAAMAFGIYLVVYTLLKFAFLYFQYKLIPFNDKSLWLGLFFGIVLALLLLVPGYTGSSLALAIAIVLGKCLLVFVAYVWFTLTFNISEDINTTLLNYYRKYILRSV